jgi:hypothetical protein
VQYTGRGVPPAVPMARIRQEDTGIEIVLEPHHLVGRSEHCSLRLPDSYVSAEHASIRWDGTSWLVKDLGSRNGTFVDDVPLTPASAAALKLDSRIAFGDQGRAWKLIDDEAPSTMAIPAEGGDPIVASGGLLVLPSPDDPSVTVYRDQAGAWVVDTGRALEKATDQGAIEVAGKRFRLSLPQATAETSPLEAMVGRRAGDLCLRFRVSQDEEHVELHVETGSTWHDLGARAHNYMLLYLARHRLKDGDLGLPPTSCGWVYQDELCEALRLDPERLNVDVYRIRRQFAALQVLDPAEVLERRPRTRQIRVGPRRNIIERI